MRTASPAFAGFGAACAALLVLTACDVSVDKTETDHKADVNITTPVGHVSVHAGDETADTGMHVYPGARPRRDGDRAKAANVNVGGSFFGVNVAAAEYESDDAPAAIAAFYRNELKAFGEVTECRGNVDFKGHPSRPVCREHPSDPELQLVTGPENNQHIVAIKPRGDASQFALVHVDTRGAN